MPQAWMLAHGPSGDCTPSLQPTRAPCCSLSWHRHQLRACSESSLSHGHPHAPCLPWEEICSLTVCAFLKICVSWVTDFLYKKNKKKKKKSFVLIISETRHFRTPPWQLQALALTCQRPLYGRVPRATAAANPGPLPTPPPAAVRPPPRSPPHPATL